MREHVQRRTGVKREKMENEKDRKIVRDVQPSSNAAGDLARCFGAVVEGGARPSLPALCRLCEVDSSPPLEEPDAPAALPLRSEISLASSTLTLGGAPGALVVDGPGTDREVGALAGGSSLIAETDNPRPGPCSTDGAGELASDRLVLHLTLLLLFETANPGPVTYDAVDPPLLVKLMRNNGETLRCCRVISGDEIKSEPEEPVTGGADLEGTMAGAGCRRERIRI